MTNNDNAVELEPFENSQLSRQPQPFSINQTRPLTPLASSSSLPVGSDPPRISTPPRNSILINHPLWSPTTSAGSATPPPSYGNATDQATRQVRVIDVTATHVPRRPTTWTPEDLPPLNHTPPQNAEEAGLNKLLKAAFFYAFMGNGFHCTILHVYVFGRWSLDRAIPESRVADGEVDRYLRYHGDGTGLVAFEAAGQCVRDALDEVKELRPESDDVRRVVKLMEILQIPE